MLQKDFGLKKDLAIKFSAYQAEYGSPQAFVDLKPNEYLTKQDISNLKPIFDKKIVINFCKRYPAVCKGIPRTGVPKH